MLLLLLLSLVYDGIKVHGRFSLQRCHCKQEAIILSHHHTHTHTHTQADSHTLVQTATDGSPVKMLRRSLRSVGLRLSRPQHEGGRGATASRGDVHRRDASSTGSTTSTSTVMGDSVRQKTIDDLGGPSFLTTLNWLFVKGYFQTSQQLQVSGTCVCVCVCVVWFALACAPVY